MNGGTKPRLSEIVAALADAWGHSLTAPQAAHARELTARAGWMHGCTSWEELLDLIAGERYPPPGLERVIDDYGE